MTIFWRHNRQQEGRSKDSGFEKSRFSLSAFFVLLVLFTFSISLNGFSENMIEVRGISKQTAPDSLRVIVDLSAPVQYTKGRLSNPERLFIDIKNARISKGAKNDSSGADAFLRGIRLGQFNMDTVRIVLDLQDNNFNFDIDTHNAPARLVIDIYSKERNNNKKPSQQPEEISVKRRIVLDPGHGGHDPGAVGYNGLYEKDVVLDIALKIREIMKTEHPLYEIMLTRDSDVFIPLHKRAEIANNANADMFISIHANASYNRMAYGIETYILNWTDDEEAMRVAARENAISLKEMKRLRDELSIILASLESESKRDESIKVAGFIQRSLVSGNAPDYLANYDRGIKQALFYVLVGAKMPSALLEVGFISNPLEEKMLNNETHRLNIANSIISGILKYFSDLPIKRLMAEETLPHNQENKTIPVKYSKFKK